MVECEKIRRDRAASPLPGESAAVSVNAPTTPPTMSVAGLLAHSQLLDSVAAFTHHRDVDALDHSLALSLAELTSARSVVLGKRIIDSHDRLDSVVHCAPDVLGKYQLRVIEPDLDDPALAPLCRCMERLEVQTSVTDEGFHRLIVPILCEGRAIGALQLESELPSSASRPLVDGFARIYANYTALLNESERDKLTGLFNRRTFERHLQRLLQPGGASAAMEPMIERRTMMPPSQVWLAIIDIDHFKRINDSYGHIYGDEVILLLAQQMRACFRSDDVLFRFGGEEFVILLGAEDEVVVKTVLERFRQRLAEHVFPQVEHVTVSIGYAHIGEHDYPATVLDRADKALYFAKDNGRNQIHGYEKLAAQGLLGKAMESGSIDLF